MELQGLGEEASSQAATSKVGMDGSASFLLQLSNKLKEGLWWGCVGYGVYVAWGQGWLPFWQPSTPPRSANLRQPPHSSAAGQRGLAGSSLPPQPPSSTDAAAPASDVGGLNSAQMTDENKAALEALTARAQHYADEMKCSKLGIDHMVLALAENPRFSEIVQCMDGLSPEQIKAAVKKSRVLFNHTEPEEELVPEVQTALSRYARDLTAAAREGKLDPLVGRADEIRRVINILCRRSKNNPVILGEPGVGKTALVEGLAARIVDGDVPEALQGVQLMALDMGLLMAGAFMPGEFEERLKGVLKELTTAGAKFVLFIDDLHNVTGPNASQGGGVMDASVLLKPLLGRGELRCIGATSPDKFKKFIEKDPALERRFQQVQLDAPNVSDSVSILRGLRARLERHHAVRISESALTSAVTLSDRYITDRFLPDKALDLVDEACARVRVDMSLKPELLDKAERRITALEAERRLLRRNALISKADSLALEGVEQELAGLRAQRTDLFERYQAEQNQSGELVGIHEQIDALTDEIEVLEDQADKAEELAGLTKKRAELVKKMRALQESWLAKDAAQGGKGAKRRNWVVRGEVSEADVARVISDWTGIPLTKLVETEVDKVLQLADELHRRIIGQEEAVCAVAEAIQRSRAGMRDPNGPIASFLFLGPTGVGKTELAKALAVALFNTEESMIRLDMSEFMEKHAVSKLIGAPPGYVGFDEGGQLTEKVRHKPYSVILFDEVEKAHVDVFNVLLQILDDGRVTDGQGRLVSFKNTLIIMTSNLGSQEVYRHSAAARAKGSDTDSQAGRAQDKEKIKELVMEQVRKHFRPEFINRVDEFIIFDPLRADQMQHIVSLRLRGVVSRLAEKRIRLVVSARAMAYLAVKGFDPVFGGRPVRRVIQREMETPLARALLRNDFQEDDAVMVSLDEAGGEAAAGPVLTFTRIAGGATPAGGQAVSAALAAEEAAAATAAATAEAAQASTTAAAAAAPQSVPKGLAGGTLLGDMKARPVKFDPLKKISTLAESGTDLSKDGSAARADPDSLPTSEN